MINSTDYKSHGYENREEYLRCMAEDYGLSLQVVHSLAELLGPNEDFDGLVVALEAASDDL